VRAVAPALFGAPVTVPSPAEYVALGAARQAAWVLRGGDEPPEWPVAGVDAPGEATPAVRERYGAVRDRARELLM
jgi:xylulokinase